MKKIELSIEGMHCASCKTLIEDELEDISGITSKKVETGRAIIEFDDKKTNEAVIKKTIISLGYKVV